MTDTPPTHTPPTQTPPTQSPPGPGTDRQTYAQLAYARRPEPAEQRDLAAPLATADGAGVPADDDPTIAFRGRRSAGEGAGTAQATLAPPVPTQAAPLQGIAEAAGDTPPPRGPSSDNSHPPVDRRGERGLRGRIPRLRIGSHLVAPQELARFGLAGPSAGLVVGVDYERTPVAVRLFRPEPTRVAIVGGTWATQLLVFRAFGAGARVVVVSDHAQHWLNFAEHATGRADRLVVLPPRHDIRAATAHRPSLVVDDRGSAAVAFAAALGPWQTQITLLRQLDPTGFAVVRGCDLAILQRLGDTEAAIAVDALSLPRRSLPSLQTLPDDVLAIVADGAETYVSVAQTGLERSFTGVPRRT